MSLAPPGFYGKLPARGDFLSRRVPPGFAAAWDGWLASLTQATRARAGDAWPEAWLTAPLWHFTLGMEVAPPLGIAGVLVASADRVGRLFPFSILGPSPGEPEARWAEAIEALILDALDDAFDPERLDRALADLGPPTGATPVEAGCSLWWCRGSDRVAACRWTIPGLPGAAAAAAMVLGPETPGSAP